MKYLLYLQGNDLNHNFRKLVSIETKKAEPFLTLPFPSSNFIRIYFLKNFFLPYPASPINPEPRRSIVAGSGTGGGIIPSLHP